MKRKLGKPLISFFVAVALLLSCSVFSAAYYNNVSRTGYHLSAGVEVLNTQFQSGVGPSSGGHALDYVYYEPEDETQEYPLVIWLHGMSHGDYPGAQLEDNDISKWTSFEYQSRFEDSGGAYILCPRSPENEDVYWWDDGMTESLKALIDDFIIQHPNVDTDRIYIGGFSLGGYMTIEMCKTFPDFFAAAFPVCPALEPINGNLSMMADLPVWLVACSDDPLVPYRSIVCNFWAALMKYSDVKSQCRFSTLSEVFRSDGSRAESNHQSWEAVTADMFTDLGGDYYSMTTKNGNGREVTLSYPEGMIAWLSLQSR